MDVGCRGLAFVHTMAITVARPLQNFTGFPNIGDLSITGVSLHGNVSDARRFATWTGKDTMAVNRATRIALICAGQSIGARSSVFGSDNELVDEEEKRVLQMYAGDIEVTGPLLAAPERNAVQTASLVSKIYEVEEALSELNFGRWTQMTLHSVAEAEPDNLQAWLSDPYAAPHGGETIADLIERARLWLDSHVTRGGKLVAVANQSMIRAMLIAILDAPAQAFWRLDVTPLSRTELSADGRRWSIRMGGRIERT